MFTRSKQRTSAFLARSDLEIISIAIVSEVCFPSGGRSEMAVVSEVVSLLGGRSGR